MKFTKLILIRHGQTLLTSQGKYCSFTDVELNKTGRSQARKLSKALRKEKIHSLYSSDMKRTRQFAQLAFQNVPVKECTALREMNFGIFEGLHYDKIMETYPEPYKKWLGNPCDTVIPKGESVNNLAKRVRKAFKKILIDNKNKTFAIVTHAGPIKIILCDILKLSLKNIWQIEPALAGISVIEFIKGKSKIRLLNSCLYLYG